MGYRDFLESFVSEAKSERAIAKIVELFGHELLKRLAKGTDAMSERYADDLDGFLNWLVEIDPSPNSIYVDWMIRRYLAGDFRFAEDLGKMTDLLTRFQELKRVLPVEQRDINQYSSGSLYRLITQHTETDSRSESQKDRDTEKGFFSSGDAVLHYDSPEMKIIIPKTKEAAQWFGKNTQWCTSAKSNNMFDYYNREGPLYIILFKKTNTRWQFHFESDQFMDEQDEALKLDQIESITHLFEVPVHQDGSLIRYIKNPSEEIKLAAVRQDGYSIEYIENPSEAVQLAAVQQNGQFLDYIEHPSEAVQLAAVRQDGLAIRFITNQSETVKLAAVQRDGNAVYYIENPSEEIQIAAVQQDGLSVRYIANPSEKIQLIAVQQDGWAIQSIEKPSEAVQLAAVKQNPQVIMGIREPCEAAKEIASKALSESVLLEDRTEGLIKRFAPEIAKNWHRLQHLASPDLGVENENDIIRIITNADPDPKKKHSTWLVTQFIKGNFNLEDHERVYHALDLYTRVKAAGAIPRNDDIMRYPTLQSLYDAMEPFKNQKSGTIVPAGYEQKMAKESSVVLDNSEIIITIPLTQEAAQWFGRTTEWCTAYGGKYSNYPDRTPVTYTGSLYVIQDKKSGELFQMHLESGQLMDAADRPMPFNTMAKRYPSILEFIAGVREFTHGKLFYKKEYFAYDNGSEIVVFGPKNLDYVAKIMFDSDRKVGEVDYGWFVNIKTLDLSEIVNIAKLKPSEFSISMLSLYFDGQWKHIRSATVLGEIRKHEGKYIAYHLRGDEYAQGREGKDHSFSFYSPLTISDGEIRCSIAQSEIIHLVAKHHGDPNLAPEGRVGFDDFRLAKDFPYLASISFDYTVHLDTKRATERAVKTYGLVDFGDSMGLTTQRGVNFMSNVIDYLASLGVNYMDDPSRVVSDVQLLSRFEPEELERLESLSDDLDDALNMIGFRTLAYDAFTEGLTKILARHTKDKLIFRDGEKWTSDFAIDQPCMLLIKKDTLFPEMVLEYYSDKLMREVALEAFSFKDIETDILGMPIDYDEMKRQILAMI